MHPRALFLIPLLLAFGCLETSQTGDLQADLDEVKTQLLVLQKEHAAIQDRLDEQNAVVASAVQQDREAERVGQADLLARVDSLTMEMEVLGQKLEDTNFRLSGLSSDIQAARSLMEESRYVGGAPTGAAVGAAAAGAAGGDGADDDEEAPTAAGPREGTLASSPIVGGAPPEEIFNTSYADYTKGNYPLAILGFQEYLQRFPDSAFADDALYWVGESYYSQGKYNDAVEAFGELIDRYPQGDKVPAAHLKRGFAFLELNQTAQGVLQLNALIEGFPHTDEARLARERLRSLGL
ncbi:MAG: tol-pal system protein YbgF [Acidobacteriota bacterium]|jgi:tol-pal system protein YbgF